MTEPRRILCAHADENGEGAHWKTVGEPCPRDRPRAGDAVTTDPFFLGRYRERLGETRGAIKELEDIVQPLRSTVDQIESRLRVLRKSEAVYLEALNE